MDPQRPVVGVVGSDHTVNRYFGELPVVGTPRWYVDQVRRACGRAVVLPGLEAADLLDVVDALVLTGGGDLDPVRHGGVSGSGVDVDPARDEAEIALVRRAAATGVPLLGVCRGLQVLVTAFGGSLVADLGMTHVLPKTGHPVVTRPGSVVQDLLGPRPVVTSLHHQAAAALGASWRATAWADDGVVEAVEWTGASTWPVLGVQWHPELEEEGGRALFGWLVSEARHARAGFAGLAVGHWTGQDVRVGRKDPCTR